MTMNQATLLVAALVLRGDAIALHKKVVESDIQSGRRRSKADGNIQFGEVLKDGHTIHYKAGNNGGFWRNYKTWEPETFKVFDRFVTDKVMLDVGAWIGPTVLWSAHVAKTVVALEPTPKAFAELSANIELNPDVKGRIVALNQALDGQDRSVHMSNRGDSADRITSLIEVPAVTIDTLRKEHPVLEDVKFVKVDTEGHEHVIVPALREFLEEKKPNMYVSLHEQFIGHEKVQDVVDTLGQIFPYLYEVDMKTPFNTNKPSYTLGDHGGDDVVCTWTPL